MRITKTTCFLFGVALLGVGFYALVEHNAETALRGNARTLYRPSSFPVEHKPSAEEKQKELAALEAARLAAEAKIPKTPPKHPDGLRNVGGTRTPPPAVTATLQRVAHVKIPRKSKQPPPKELVLYRPVAVDGATLSDKKKRISLHHVQAVPLSTTCPSEDGERWPCGIRARTALRAFIRQKRVTCSDMKPMQGDDYAATCNVGKHDLATWLIENGWAKAERDAPEALKDVAAKARRAEQGIWRSKLVQLSDDVSATLVNSWEELADDSTSETPLVMEGEPAIIWRPREDVTAETSATE
ncbi:thermonuclease family protein [Pseudovibrio sp. SCP19]|uniref:thermonuclease family protein n=1 Tax=Pseudovibrio sp. SCP19 TaxID=3141374 RepID=UPI00333DCAD2